MSRVLGAGLGATILNQDIYEMSATAKHRLGTRVVRGDRVFKYAKAIPGYGFTDGSVATLLSTKFACWRAINEDIKRANMATAVPIGGNKIYVRVAATDGVASVPATGVIAEHELEGGYVIIWHATGTRDNYAILDNTAATSGTDVEITLDGELTEAVVAGDDASVMGSMYRVAWKQAGSYYSIFVGVPMMPLCEATPYGWLQTWGPRFLSFDSSVGVNHQTDLIFRPDGAVGTAQTIASEDGTYAQHAGWAISRDNIDPQQHGAPFIMLEVSP